MDLADVIDGSVVWGIAGIVLIISTIVLKTRFNNEKKEKDDPSEMRSDKTIKEGSESGNDSGDGGGDGGQ